MSLTTVLDEALRRMKEYGVSPTNPLILPTVALLASRYANSAYEKYTECYDKLTALCDRHTQADKPLTKQVEGGTVSLPVYSMEQLPALAKAMETAKAKTKTESEVKG